MKRCQINKRLISAYLDGELDMQDARRVKKHLSVCDECARVARQYQEVYDLLLQPALQCSDFFVARVKAQLTSRQARKMSWKKRMSRLSFSFAIVSGLLIGIGLGIQIREMQNEQASAHKETGALDSYIDTSVFDTMPDNSLTESYIRLSSHKD